MDGLIPMLYKSLKRTKTTRQYQCLSQAPPAESITHTYNIADFYTDQNDHHHHGYLRREHDHDQKVNRVPGIGGAHHRRYSSARVGGGGDYRGFGLEEVKPKQLVRFRSSKMFSCVTGTA